MSTLRLFADKISHPSRFCIQFLQINKISYEEVNVNLMRGANKNHPELPFKQIPVLKVNNDLTISQSTSILRYLADSHPEIDEKFYPKSLDKRAGVNEFMDFFHSTMNAVSFKPIVCRLPDDSLMAAEQLLDDCLTTACSLMRA